MNVKSKYLKDESGQVISPVVSTQTVYDASGNTLGGGIIPIGGILPYVGKTAPLNYLLCDGSDFSQSVYPELYNLLGHAWTPDMRGLVIVGWDTAEGGLKDMTFDCSTILTTGGESKHTLTISEIPSHTHGLAMQAGNQTGIIDRISVKDYVNCNWYSHVQYTGGSQPHNNLQPYIVLNYIIRAK